MIIAASTSLSHSFFFFADPVMVYRPACPLSVHQNCGQKAFPSPKAGTARDRVGSPPLPTSIRRSMPRFVSRPPDRWENEITHEIQVTLPSSHFVFVHQI